MATFAELLNDESKKNMKLVQETAQYAVNLAERSKAAARYKANTRKSK